MKNKQSGGTQTSSGKSQGGPHTLAIDIGGTGLKATVLDSAGKMLVKRARVATPYPCRPDIMLKALGELTAPLPSFDRVSIGFPGVIRGGRVITAPHFDAKAWQNYALEEAAASRFGKPARVLNDAEVQGLGIVSGKGFEVVLTLGTGVGSALFNEGRLAPHLELAQHPIHESKTYNDYVGEAARKGVSVKKWNRRVRRTIDIVYALLHYDVLHIGGGNSANITGDLPDNVRLASNDAGLTGGIRLWDDKVWQAVPEQQS
jgi:polyphosphate glucokinase